MTLMIAISMIIIMAMLAISTAMVCLTFIVLRLLKSADERHHSTHLLMVSFEGREEAIVAKSDLGLDLWKSFRANSPNLNEPQRREGGRPQEPNKQDQPLYDFYDSNPIAPGVQ